YFAHCFRKSAEGTGHGNTDSLIFQFHTPFFLSIPIFFPPAGFRKISAHKFPADSDTDNTAPAVLLPLPDPRRPAPMQYPQYMHPWPAFLIPDISAQQTAPY